MHPVYVTVGDALIYLVHSGGSDRRRPPLGVGAKLALARSAPRRPC